MSIGRLSFFICKKAVIVIVQLRLRLSSAEALTTSRGVYYRHINNLVNPPDWLCLTDKYYLCSTAAVVTKIKAVLAGYAAPALATSEPSGNATVRIVCAVVAVLLVVLIVWRRKRQPRG